MNYDMEQKYILTLNSERTITQDEVIESLCGEKTISEGTSSLIVNHVVADEEFAKTHPSLSLINPSHSVWELLFGECNYQQLGHNLRVLETLMSDNNIKLQQHRINLNGS